MAIAVIIQGKFVTIFPGEGAPKFANALGFEDEFRNAKNAFSERLYRLSLELDKQIIKSDADLQELTGKAYEDAVRSSLTLSNGSRDLALDDLKLIGAKLRRLLNPDIAKALTSFGVMREPVEDEPTITFINHELTTLVLWDMLYEEEDSEENVEWERFWGFKVPLTHWDSSSPANRIKLKRGLFSAIDQKLIFAASEVSLLAQQMTGGLSHRSLCDEIRSRVAEALRDQIPESPDEWIKQQGANTWLRTFIEKLNAGIVDNDAIILNTRNWKKKVLRAIFTDPTFTYEMIHFACHCEPNEVSELLSELRIHIAGEDISLTVASMPADKSVDRPGPLVFLNACGTGQQGPSAEPPGFPKSWISENAAVAVVATLCPVPDLFAHAFARKFYHNLFKSLDDPNAPVRERYLSEALLETRRYFMEECGNPLGLAYVLYAVKDACIEPRM
jgi:hypothetical protein